MKAQNSQARHASWLGPEATGRSQREKESVYKDRRLAAKFIGDHTMGDDPDEPLQGLMEFLDRHDNSAVRLYEAQQLADEISFQNSLEGMLMLQGVEESSDRTTAVQSQEGLPLSRNIKDVSSVGARGL